MLIITGSKMFHIVPKALRLAEGMGGLTLDSIAAKEYYGHSDNRRQLSG